MTSSRSACFIPVARHRQYMDCECVNLNAGTNVVNPRAERWRTCDVAGRMRELVDN
jgi:hypothetical protein